MIFSRASWYVVSLYTVLAGSDTTPIPLGIPQPTLKELRTNYGRITTSTQSVLARRLRLLSGYKHGKIDSSSWGYKSIAI